MSNPSKAKGTAGETELLRLLLPVMPNLVRTPASSIVDLHAQGDYDDYNVELLATRPDRGQWLVTMRLAQFVEFWPTMRDFDRVYGRAMPGVRIEVKRYKRFSLHQIFESKFGDKAS